MRPAPSWEQPAAAQPDSRWAVTGPAGERVVAGADRAAAAFCVIVLPPPGWDGAGRAGVLLPPTGLPLRLLPAIPPSAPPSGSRRPLPQHAGPAPLRAPSRPPPPCPSQHRPTAAPAPRTQRPPLLLPPRRPLPSLAQHQEAVPAPLPPGSNAGRPPPTSTMARLPLSSARRSSATPIRLPSPPAPPSTRRPAVSPTGCQRAATWGLAGRRARWGAGRRSRHRSRCNHMAHRSLACPPPVPCRVASACRLRPSGRQQEAVAA